jgi:hypothetical protein
MSLAGTWIFTQGWNNGSPYSLEAVLKADGSLATTQGGYVGTWTVQGNQVALAIAQFGRKSVASYCGNFLGGTMGGSATALSPSGKSVPGVWAANQQPHPAPAADTPLLPE